MLIPQELQLSPAKGRQAMANKKKTRDSKDMKNRLLPEIMVISGKIN